jgi:ABC-type lipoprotein export system ATPase subunit
MNPKIKKLTILPGKNKSGAPEVFDKIEINTGEIIAIVGPTGCGKSQLLYDIEKLACGTTKSKRKILINDQTAEKEWRFDPKQKLIASLAQSMNFLTDLSVKEFLELHIHARGKSANQNLVEETIKKTNAITGEPITPEMNLLNLSGGQTRALMVADAAHISTSPIILIDEIENAGIKKEKALEILIQEGKIVFLVTHDPSLALNANKRLVIQNGGIISVLQTTEKEKEIANYLNWLEGYNLDMRDEIRQGKQIEELKIVCKPKEETLRNDFSQKLKIPQGERNKK